VGFFGLEQSSVRDAGGRVGQATGIPGCSFDGCPAGDDFTGRTCRGRTLALSHLDTNEGYASRFIGSPETICQRIELYRELGVDMLHLELSDQLFVERVLPVVHGL
jgi:hypothetical protein